MSAVDLTPGANTPLPGATTVEIAVTYERGHADVVCLLLDANDRADGDEGVALFSRPVSAGGAVRLDPQADKVVIDVQGLPPAVEKILVVANADSTPTIDALGRVDVTAQSGGQVIARAGFPSPPNVAALQLVEVYRRAGNWKLRSLGDGYADGLAKLLTVHGVEVTDAPAAVPPPPAPAPPPPLVDTSRPSPPAPAASPSPTARIDTSRPDRAAPPPPGPRPDPPAGAPPGMTSGSPIDTSRPDRAAPPPPPPPPPPTPRAPAAGPSGAPPRPGPPGAPPPPPGPPRRSGPPGAAAPSGASGPPVDLNKPDLPASGGVKLSKGGGVTLRKEGQVLTNVVMGLGWDPAVAGRNIDLDASCVMLDAQGETVDAVSFMQLKSKDGSVKHSGDNLTGEGEGDDETIGVNLATVSDRVVLLGFTVNSFAGQGFQEVANAFCRLLDTGGRELVRFELSERGPHRGVVMASLERGADGWTMTARGDLGDGRTYRDLIPTIAGYVTGAAPGGGGSGKRKSGRLFGR